MNSFVLSEKSVQASKEYLNYPSLVLREVKSYQGLSQGAKHCWELLYDLSKFAANRCIEICIKQIIRLLNKSYRTIQRYLSQLLAKGFVSIKENYDQYGRLENAYTVLVPQAILDAVENSNKKVFIKPTQSTQKPVNTRYDSFVQGNKELINSGSYVNKNNNTVVFKESEGKEKNPNSSETSHLKRWQLRYAKGMIANVAKAGTKISNPKELFSQICFTLTSAFQIKDANFKKKVNVIAKILRSGKWTTPIGFYNHSEIGKQYKQQRSNLSESKSSAYASLAANPSSLKFSDLLTQHWKGQRGNNQLTRLQTQLAKYQQMLQDKTTDVSTLQVISSMMTRIKAEIYELKQASSATPHSWAA